MSSNNSLFYRKTYVSENINTPLSIIPTFDLAANNQINAISMAIVTISSGCQPGDRLELDGNLTLVKTDAKIMIKNTNITVQNGGFNGNTKELVFTGNDSPATYEEVLSSILLDNDEGFFGSVYEISFSIIDDEANRYWLGHSILDCSTHVPCGETILNDSDHEILNNLFEW